MFVADAATTALYGVIVLAALPETRPAAHARPDGAPGAARAIFGDPFLLAVCGLTFAFSIVFFQSFVGLPIDVRAHGLSAVAFGTLIAINGLLIVFLQPVAGELTAVSFAPLDARGCVAAAGHGSPDRTRGSDRSAAMLSPS